MQSVIKRSSLYPIYLSDIPVFITQQKHFKRIGHYHIRHRFTQFFYKAPMNRQRQKLGISLIWKNLILRRNHIFKSDQNWQAILLVDFFLKNIIHVIVPVDEEVQKSLQQLTLSL